MAYDAVSRLRTLFTPVAFAAFLAGSSSLHAQTVTQGDDPGLARLGAEIERIAADLNGTLGVGALHLETGRAVYLNGNDAFPMASTFKVPIADHGPPLVLSPKRNDRLPVGHGGRGTLGQPPALSRIRWQV